MRLPWQILAVVLSMAYPLAWYWGREHGLFRWLAGCMALVWTGRALVQHGRGARLVSVLVAVFFGFALCFDWQSGAYWYPVLLNGLLLMLFGGSLFGRQSLVERLARLRHPVLPPRAVRYTRRVTQVWCVFFAFNMVVTVALIVGEAWHAWALYTGVIAYVLMALLFSVEWLCRRRVMRAEGHAD